jgi:hypothetical protein
MQAHADLSISVMSSFYILSWLSKYVIVKILFVLFFAFREVVLLLSSEDKLYVLLIDVAFDGSG